MGHEVGANLRIFFQCRPFKRTKTAYLHRQAVFGGNAHLTLNLCLLSNPSEKSARANIVSFDVLQQTACIRGQAEQPLKMSNLIRGKGKHCF